MLSEFHPSIDRHTHTYREREKNRERGARKEGYREGGTERKTDRGDMRHLSNALPCDIIRFTRAAVNPPPSLVTNTVVWSCTNSIHTTRPTVC